MIGAVKNQHFVPQSYLDRFAENKRVSVFFIEDGRLLSNQNPRNYAAERYYYDVSKDELKELLKQQVEINPDVEHNIDWDNPQLIEVYFSRCEADVKELFDRLEKGTDQIASVGNIAKIVVFLHDLAYRNHAYRDTIAKINEVTYLALMQLNLTEEQRQYVEKTYGQKQARDQQLHAITDVAPVLQTYTKLFGEYELYFATAEKDARFLISDDPAFAIRLDEPEICFPLSGKHALLFRRLGVTASIMGADMPIGNRISISIPNVVRYNTLQFCAASRYVFGDAFNLGQMKLLLEKTQVINIRSIFYTIIWA